MQNNVRTFGKLRERIKAVYGTQQAFAEAMGMNKATLNAKLNGKASWNSKEIENVCTLLNIPMTETPEYFFY